MVFSRFFQGVGVGHGSKNEVIIIVAVCSKTNRSMTQSERDEDLDSDGFVRMWAGLAKTNLIKQTTEISKKPRLTRRPPTPIVTASVSFLSSPVFCNFAFLLFVTLLARPPSKTNHFQTFFSKKKKIITTTN